MTDCFSGFNGLFQKIKGSNGLFFFGKCAVQRTVFFSKMQKTVKIQIMFRDRECLYKFNYKISFKLIKAGPDNQICSEMALNYRMQINYYHIEW
jgi:hypothetical protein